MDHTRGVAVVTGAAGAIGTALTATLTDAGYDVVGLDLPMACPADRAALGARAPRDRHAALKFRGPGRRC